MKKFSFVLCAFALAVACCLTSCKKEESDTTETGTVAQLGDFIGTYNVEITETSLLGALVGGTTYSAVMTIDSAEASVYGIPLYTAKHVAKFTFEPVDEELKTKGYLESLSGTYGYVKDGYLVLAVADNTLTHTIFYNTQMPYKQSEAMKWTGYYGEKGSNLADLVTTGTCKLEFSAVRTAGDANGIKIRY
ncbi:MAG: hypothetical protein KBT04_01700 [Bacteroidales bacterium]|nr:hypothetical protein [Candidatus Colimorpha onthohippi]